MDIVVLNICINFVLSSIVKKKLSLPLVHVRMFKSSLLMTGNFRIQNIVPNSFILYISQKINALLSKILVEHVQYKIV